MIRNWDYQTLHMDYSSMFEGNKHPSDIDLLYLGKDGILILGEIKNERGHFKNGQRRLLENIINHWDGDGLILYITHNCYWQNGDRNVNVAECKVREVFFKAEQMWRPPDRPVTVKQVLEHYMEE